jgi:hypothetical protein
MRHGTISFRIFPAGAGSVSLADARNRCLLPGKTTEQKKDNPVGNTAQAFFSSSVASGWSDLLGGSEKKSSIFETAGTRKRDNNL